MKYYNEIGEGCNETVHIGKYPDLPLGATYKLKVIRDGIIEKI